MATRNRAPDGVVTGVATGNLGTGTALDDTQLYSADAAMAEGNAPNDDALDVLPPPEPARLAEQPIPVADPLVRPRFHPRTRATGGYSVGFLVAGLVAVVVIAGLLTLRDGGLGGGSAGAGIAGAAGSHPPIPTYGALPTGAPVATPPANGHGHGHGHGPH